MLSGNEFLEALRHAQTVGVGLVLVDDRTESVNSVSVEENIDLDEVSDLLAALVVVKRGVAASARFEVVEEVEDDLREGKLVVQLDAIFREVVHSSHGSTTILAQFHDRSREFSWGQDCRIHDGFANLGDLPLGEFRRVIDLDLGPIFCNDLVDDVGRGCNQVQFEFALEAFADNFQVQQSEESTAEAEAQGRTGFRLKGQRRIVELEAFQSVAQIREIGAINGVNARKDHGARIAIAGQRFFSASNSRGHGVTNAGLTNILHAGNKVANFASCNSRSRSRFR